MASSSAPNSAPPIIRPESPSSDTESVLSSSQPPSRAGGLHSANFSSLNLSSLGLPPAASSSNLLSGFNAISTVLNNPKKRQHPIDPGSSRYPPLPTHKEAEVKRPQKLAVQTYIDEVSAEWERYVRNRSLGSRGKANTKRESSAERGDGDQASSSALLESATLSRSKLPPLSSVPQVFFDENFALGNPYTFDIVTEKYGDANPTTVVTTEEAAGTGQTATADHAGADHLEKLSHYSDLVEQHLLHEISTRSSSFFSALGTLQDLSHSSASCLSLIRSLRTDLVSISDNQVKTGLKIVRKQDERHSLLREMRGVEKIKRWCQRQRMAELMVEQGEYEDALLVIQSLRRDVQPRVLSADLTLTEADTYEAGDPPPTTGYDEDDVDLAQIPAIAALLPQLDDLEGSIAHSLESELIALLESDLETRPSGENSEWGLRLRVEPLIMGLTRTKGLERSLTSSYRPIALGSIRQALRASLPSTASEPLLGALFDLLDDDAAATGRAESKTGEAGANAARRLREMDTAAFEGVINTACGGLQAGIKQIERQQRGVLELLDAIARRSSPGNANGHSPSINDADFLMPEGVAYILPTQLTSQLHASIEVAHILLARLISLRASNHAQSSIHEFLRIFNPLMKFAETTERVSLSRVPSTDPGNTSGMRRLIPLRSTLLNQFKEWLRHFHRVRLEQAARWVEEETWAQTEVGYDSTQVVRKLVNSATEDPPEWLVESSAPPLPSTTNGGEREETYKTLAVPADSANGIVDGDEKSYYMVPATLKVLDLTQEYIEAIINFDKIGSTEIMSRAVEFLKQFNSRTCQVVLGAGAMRSAGLKNITAKHLALASQSLSLFIHLIPYLRECVRRHLPDERQAIMLVEFDKLKRDYQEHQFEIHAKLVAIMGDRLSVHCRGLAATKWNAPLGDSESAPASDAAPTPSKPIADLVKETTTLYKVLSKYLQFSIVEGVTSQVLDAIIKRVGMEFAKVEVTQEGGNACRTRMERDVDFLDQKLATLKGGKWNSEPLRSVAAGKTPPAQAPAPPAPATSPPPTQSAPATPSMGSNAAVMSPTLSGQAPQTPTQAQSAVQSTSVDSPGGARAGPPAYRSRMFPFGRRNNAQQSQPQTQAQSPRQGPSSPAMGSPSSLPWTRSHSRVAAERDGQGSDSQRGSLDVMTLPPPVTESAALKDPPSEQVPSAAGEESQEKVDAETPLPESAEAVAESSAVPAAQEAEAAETGKAEPTDVPTAAGEQSQQPRQEEKTLPEAPARPPVDASSDAAINETQATDASSPAEADAGASASDEAASEAKSAERTAPAQAEGDEAGSTAAQTTGISTTEAEEPPPTPSKEPANAPVPAEATPLSPGATSAPTAAQMQAPTSTPTSTPTKPGRMTLKERLAEAARKRAAASNSAAAPGASSAVGDNSTRPAEAKTKGEESGGSPAAPTAEASAPPGAAAEAQDSDEARAESHSERAEPASQEAAVSLEASPAVAAAPAEDSAQEEATSVAASATEGPDSAEAAAPTEAQPAPAPDVDTAESAAVPAAEPADEEAQADSSAETAEPASSESGAPSEGKAVSATLPEVASGGGNEAAATSDPPTDLEVAQAATPEPMTDAVEEESVGEGGADTEADKEDAGADVDPEGADSPATQDTSGKPPSAAASGSTSTSISTSNSKSRKGKKKGKKR